MQHFAFSVFANRHPSSPPPPNTPNLHPNITAVSQMPYSSLLADSRLGRGGGSDVLLPDLKGNRRLTRLARVLSLCRLLPSVVCSHFSTPQPPSCYVTPSYQSLKNEQYAFQCFKNLENRIIFRIVIQENVP